MKYERLLACFVAFTLVLCNALPVGAVDIVTMSDRLWSITNNCSNIKMNLKKLQTSDAVIRVGLGRNYEFTLNKLMINMNSRLAVNHKDAGELLSITASFSENLGYFRKNYITYDQQIDKLNVIDCQKNPQDFYDGLRLARIARGEVRFNYVKLNAIIEDYRNELEKVAERL